MSAVIKIRYLHILQTMCNFRFTNVMRLKSHIYIPDVAHILCNVKLCNVELKVTIS